MEQQSLVKKQPLFLKHIYLQNFRNYEEASFSFGPHLNVIFGDNAQGKSSLLEAISLISTGRSFRTQVLSELIHYEKPHFYLEAEIIRDGVPQNIKLSFDGKTKKLFLNASEFSTFSPLLGSFPSVFSLPSDRGLITDAPSVRRRFLNLHLAQSDPLYVHHLARFWRAMKQRNCLLKAKKMDSLDCWESEMALSAQYISHARKTFLTQLENPLKMKGKSLSGKNEIMKTSLLSTYPPDAKTYEKQLHNMRKREKEMGVTLQGPHRDDLAFLIDNKIAKNYASEGQKKTMITALRLSQWKHLSNQIEDLPFFAIDDFEGMLDTNRQKYLSTFLSSMGQVFLTTPIDPKKLPLDANSSSKHLRISSQQK